MLSDKIRNKLESLNELPTIPYVISQVLEALDNPDVSAAALANLIQKDQTLTARVLRMANSPFYGFSRKISTIDLAIVVLGLNTIKEIVLTLVIQRIFSKVRKDVFDIGAFWHYSVFCGAASRMLARKLGYRLAGEAFVCGLVHDIGILIEIEYFTDKFLKILELQKSKDLTFIESENLVIDCNHADIGAWFAEKWNLPEKICKAIKHHQSTYVEVAKDNENSMEVPAGKDDPFPEPLTAIVAMSEWFAKEMEFKEWARESKPSDLYLANEVLDEIKSHDIYESDSAIEVLKHEILKEYERTSVINELPSRSV